MERKQITLKSAATFCAKAALGGHPNLGWIEFILTDAQPNGNKIGIAAEKFAGLVDSGMYMPLKMAEGEIHLNHGDARPLGPIVALAASDEHIVGKAVIWKKDRLDDYNMLKEMQSNGDAISISWEIFYSSSATDDDGVEWLEDPILWAATIVSSPAYGARTPVLSVASQETPTEEVTNNMEELEALKETLSERETELSELQSTLEGLQAELAELQEYKEGRETADAEATLYASRLTVLVEAGLKFSEEEKEAKRTLWLSMSDEAFAEMVTLATKLRATETVEASRVPDVSGTPATSLVDVVRKGLQEMKDK